MIPENSGCTRLMWHQPAVSDTVVSTSVCPLISERWIVCDPYILDDAVGGGCCTLACAGAVRCSTLSSKTVLVMQSFIENKNEEG